MSRRRLWAERWGRAVELLVIVWLSLRGWRVLDHRAKTPFGEIDLIAQHRQVLVFLEVKAHRGGDWRLSASQVQRIQRAADFWRAQHPRMMKALVRFDLVYITAKGLAHRQAAFGDWP